MALVGRLSFDPLEFTRLTPRNQATALLGIVDLNIDLYDLAAKRAFAYDQRTEIGRHIKILEGQAASLGKPEEGVPEQETSVTELITTYRRADIMHREHREAEQHVVNLEGQVEQARVALRKAEGALLQADNSLVAARGRVKDAPELPDLDGIQAQIDTAEATNTTVRANTERRNIKSALANTKAQYEGATNAITSFDQTKADGLAAATFPVEGLAFDDDGVTYQGIPFAQASASEQIRVSLAMAMALNPKLRVVRIMDGSLLDADSMALIAAMATEKDYQVWIERVADGSGVGVLIEDGRIAE